MADEKPKCCEMIAHPSGMLRPIYKRCTRAGVVERDGKPYCRQHDPEAVKTRRKANYEKHKSRWDAEREAARHREAAVAACRGVPTEQLRPGIVARMIDALRLVRDGATFHDHVEAEREAAAILEAIGIPRPPGRDDEEEEDDV